MALDRMLYRLTYRLGAPRWDTGMPQPELEQLVPGPFDLLLDIGCYHTIPASRRDAYVAGAAAAARPGADFYLAGIPDPARLWRLLGAHGIGDDEIKSRFARYFSIAGQQRRGARLVAYHLVRNGG